MGKTPKRTAILLTMLLLVLTSMLQFQSPAVWSYPDMDALNVDASNGESLTLLNSSYGLLEESHGQANVLSRKIVLSDIPRLKQEIGVYEAGKTYNIIIDGHGTGWRPPTEEEWAQIADNGYIVEKITSKETERALSFVDHTSEPWFPPIGNQGSEGSCTCWAVGYYMKTFQEAKEHNWDLSSALWDGGQPTPEYQDRIISPDFVYHLINEGVNQGTPPMTAINLICSIGASSWEKMPYNPSDSATWPSEEAWMEAPLYRGDISGWHWMRVITDDDVASLKNWIASGNLAAITVDASKIRNLLGMSLLTSSDMLTLDNYSPPWGDDSWHETTIVGYDDNIEYEEQGQTRYGAFKIANSWGIGGLLGWENVPDGCFWISYEAMKNVGFFDFYSDTIGYVPELVASFRLTHSKRGECNIAVGAGSQTKSFTQYVEGGNQSFCSNRILFDITDLMDSIPDIYGQQFFLRVFDGGSSTTGLINEFGVEYAESTDPMIATVNGGTVYAYVALPYLDTNWRVAKQVGLNNDFVDGKVSMATDNNGYLYIAYDDWYPAGGRQAIFVYYSTDGGSAWSKLFQWYWIYYDSKNPSMAIDPYNNKIFIAYERGTPASGYDIYCCVYTSGVGQDHVGVDTDGDNDHYPRYPSITSEYQYGSANWQYISYEYVYTYNDRDLMFAKSTDDGETWSISKLHGDLIDYNVHAQTSITNAEGYIYIAYKWGANYESPCEIRVDRSTDFGSTWTQFTDVDGSINGCSFPSIAATHGGGTVMVAFRYDFSSSNINVRYSYSTNKGASWAKGYSLLTSGLPETLPVLTVDGGGSTASDVNGYFHVACKVGSYIKYSRAHYSTPYSWTTPVIISEEWMGKSSAIATQFRNLTTEFHPYISWGDERTNNVFCSTVGHVHNLNTGLSYESIQEAINANETLNGHTLLAESRIYRERVTLNKSVTLIGEQRTDTIIRNDYTIMEVRADNSAIRCFTITGGYKGIDLLFCTNVTLEDNLVCSNEIGIALDYQSSGCKLIRNNITLNNRWGIWLWGSSNHLLRNNTLTANGHNFGIYGWNITHFTHDIDSSNEVNNGPIYYWVNETDKEVPNDAGYVALVNCSRVVVEGLNISGNEQAVLLAYTTNSTIRGNKMAGTGVGLYMYQSLHNSVVGNNVTGNSFGIYSRESSYNNITQNVVEANSYGIYLYNSSNCIWHNSFLANDIQVSSDNSSVSTWDDDYPSGGNFWSDYTGVDVFNGPNQDQMGSDGKGDTPYIIDDFNQDRFPLMYRPTVARVCFAPGTLQLDQGIQVGYEFKIALIVENIDDLYGFDIQFHWNTTYLAYINHTATIPVEAYPVPTAPSYYAGILHDPFFIAKDEVNATAGDYWIAAAHLSDQGFSGSGTVAVMAFRVIAKPALGEDDVTLLFHLTNHDFADWTATLIPHEVTDGSITIPAIRDVSVTNVKSAKTIVGKGFPLYVNATVENLGAYPENLTVTLYANATAVQTTNITIPGGNTTTVTFVWNTTDWPLGQYMLSVYVEPVLGEADTSDNTFLAGEACLTIPGDVNCDHHVDIFDIVRIARDYGKPPPPLLDPNCDIDSDGDVGIFDIVIAAGNYGKGW